jgi:kumamolisin
MANLKVFHDSIVPIPVAAGPTPNGLLVAGATEVQKQERMTLHFSLAIPPQAQAELEAAVAKGEAVPIDRLHRDYAVPQENIDSLVAFLKRNRFDIDDISLDRTSIYATASVADIEQALGVDMVRVTAEGASYTAARNAPSLPEDVAGSVQAIGGLQPFRHVRKRSIRRPASRGNRLVLGRVDDMAERPAPAIANAPPYLPSEILKAYEADSLKLTGKGQTIAILIDTFPLDSDLTHFWKQAAVPGSLQRVQKINVKGGALPPPEGEETLDVEWSSGIAPDAVIRIYATGSLSFVDLDRALDRILADLPSEPGMRQLSISLGLGETYMGGPSGEVAVQHQKFLKLAAAGVNVFVSTGDAGSNPDQTGHSPTGPVQAEYEASDSCVVAVGGTTLSLAHDGTVSQESGWSSGGGGKSILFGRPTWQQAPGISGTQRLVPDVSAPADPDEGGLVILHGHVNQYGGTSWSAPMWAGFCALINEARVAKGSQPLPFMNPLIYPLQATCFRDITSGNNGAYHATTGYDLVTGLGVPRLQALVTALLQPAGAAVTT